MRVDAFCPFVVAAIVLAITTIAVAAEVGPTNGSLVVAGGGVTDPAIYEPVLPAIEAAGLRFTERREPLDHGR